MAHRFSILTLVLGCLLGGATPLVVSPATAASFDCAKAKQADEIAICGTPELSERDTEMGALWFAWRNVPMLMGSNGVRHDVAAEFLQRRAACGGDVDCLRRVYRERIAALKDDIGKAMDNIRKMEDAGASTSVLPAPVESIISGYDAACRQLGGALASARPDIMTADLDGDGKPDYVLNPQNLSCSAAATTFCGNGGCRISIALSGNDYLKPIEVLGGQPTLSQRQNGTRVEVWVSGSNCRTSDRRLACWASYSWKDGKLDRSYQARRQADSK
jgi:uncharacterized protein